MGNFRRLFHIQSGPMTFATRLMTSCLTLLSLTLASAPAGADPVVWNDPTVTFSKASFADPTLAVNQDRLLPEIWLTRGDSQGIYNASSETGYGGTSPADTEWAWDLAGFNTGLTIEASNHAALTFNPWETAHDGVPSDTVGIPGVLHVISSDQYIDITFTSWQEGDVIRAVNGIDVEVLSGIAAFRQLLRADPGTHYALDIERHGRR